MDSNYILPSKELLDKKMEKDGKHYNLSKLILKKDEKNKLEIPIGVDEENNNCYIDLKEISGMFMCGETGSGKSVLIDSIIISLLLKNTPDDLQLVLIDPNKVELMAYEGIPHLLGNKKIANENDAIGLLNEVINIIDQRRWILNQNKIRNIESYNQNTEKKMPHIVIIIDESTEIMKNNQSIDILKKIVSDGRIFGVHLLIATNAYLERDFNKEFINIFTCILSFDLASHEQAKFINLKDANLLTVTGEALLKEKGKTIKIQAPYVSTEEINRVVNFIKNETTNRDYYGENI